jgi:hypothetical protein
MKKGTKCCGPAAKAWIAVGGLLALGLTFFIAREIPSIYRELKIMSM